VSDVKQERCDRSIDLFWLRLKYADVDLELTSKKRQAVIYQETPLHNAVGQIFHHDEEI